MGESGPSEEAIALFTNVFGYAPDPEALHAGECWQAERIDAALRRAKAEGVREARARIEHAFEHGDIVQDVLDDLDARAAQIEKGEHDDSYTPNH